MLPSLLVAAAVVAPAAPIPKDALPNPTGPAPRIFAVKPDANGTIWLTGQVFEKRKQRVNVAVVANGQQVPKLQEREVLTSNYIRRTLGDFGAKFTTVEGQPLTAEEATRRVKSGAVVLISADGKPIDRTWLKAVTDQAVVMLTEGLGTIYFQYGNNPLPQTPDPRLVLLCPTEQGTVRLPVNANAVKGSGPVFIDEVGNGRVIRGKVAIQNIDVAALPAEAAPSKPAEADGKKAIEDIKFDAYDVKGNLIPRSEALKRLRAGGLVLIAGDNRLPDAEYLKAFRDDLLVLVSAELTFPAGTPNPFDPPVKAAAAPGPAKPQPPVAQPAPPIAKPLPQILPAVPVKPAVIKPGVIQAVPPPPDR
jgi:hypothetical protein